jgi:parallel beta-helix repeat protein
MRRKYISMVIIFIFLLTLFNFKADADDETETQNKEGQIVLIGNSDLIGEAETRNWTGNGTQENPFVVENRYFETNWSGASIFIEGVSLHLIFRNCTITDDGNVSFTLLIGNAFVGDSSNITFQNCAFISNTIQGARFERSDNCSVVNSSMVIYGEEFGISFENCADVNVLNFTINGGTEFAIYVSNSIRVRVIGITLGSNGSGVGFEMVWDSVLLNNTFQNGGQFQVLAFYCKNVSIENNLFLGYVWGSAYFHSSDRCKFIGNRIENVDVGAYMIETTNSTISDNYIEASYFPFYGNGGHHNHFSGNEMINSSLYLKGTTDDLSSMVVTDDNLVNGRPVIYLKDRDLGGAEIRKDVGTIFLINVSNARITDRRFNRTYSPINLLGCTDITVQDCIIENSYDGVVAKDCTGLVLKNLKGNPYSTGFHLERCNDSIIKNNNFERCFRTIYLTQSHRNKIISNRFTSDKNMIGIYHSDDNSIENNVVNGTLELQNSFRNSILDNEIIDGELAIYEDVLWDIEQPEPRGNIVNGIRKEYYLHRMNEDIDIPENVDWVILFNLTRCSISDIEMDNGYGIKAQYCNDLTIHDSRFISPIFGIDIQNSVRTNVIGCEFNGDGGQGINVEGSTNCRIEGNLIDSKQNSISIRQSQGTEIVENQILNSWGSGISTRDNTLDTLILRNVINNSQDAGISIRDTDDTLISGNEVKNCGDYGIILFHGSERNRIYFNRFEYNRNSIEIYNDLWRQGRDDGVSNSWYYEAPGVAIGNYWLDHQGPDENEDGRIDIVYTVDGFDSNYDPYPMVKDYNEKGKGKTQGTSEVWITLFFVMIIVWLVALVAYKYYNNRGE